MEANIEWKLTWHCCICCNPAKGRVHFEDGWLIKSSFVTKDDMKTCQDQTTTKKQISSQPPKERVYHLVNVIGYWLAKSNHNKYQLL
jgi:hypothetical protein